MLFKLISKLTSEIMSDEEKTANKKDSKKPVKFDGTQGGILDGVDIMINNELRRFSR